VSQSRDPVASLGALVGGIANDVQDLVRGEIALARSELEQKFERFVAAAIWILGGALLGFAGLVVALQGVAASLALAMPVWLAFLIVGFATIVIGAAFAKSGLARMSVKSLTPDRTVVNLQKDAHLIKEHT
jgi:uncharacterized membrane protein YqjE